MRPAGALTGGREPSKGAGTWRPRMIAGSWQLPLALQHFLTSRSRACQAHPGVAVFHTVAIPGLRGLIP